MWNSILDVIFPRQCFGCGSWGTYICSTCAAKIDYFDPQVCPYCERTSLNGLTHPGCAGPLCLDGLFVLAHYRGLIPQIIHEIKYQSVFAATNEVAYLINKKYHHNFNFDYLVPVPLSTKREKIRGFNQAAKLATALSLKPTLKLLTRTKNTKPQFDLSLGERKTNVKNVFSLNPNLRTHSLINHSFCLVDDVATTGSTLFESAKVLKKSGTEKVYAITIARGG